MPPVASNRAVPIPDDTRWKGTLKRAPAWRFTRRGWAAMLLLVLIAAAVFVRCIHPFLSVNTPVNTRVLVVEGWVDDHAMEVAAREINARQYEVVYVTGGPIEYGAPLSPYKTHAASGAAVLTRLGVPTNRLQSVPAPQVRRDRTYAAALALRDWMEEHHEMPASLNLLTVGVHARRSRLLYEKALGGQCKIGVIAVQDQGYDPRRWWAYSKGVRSVVDETVAYLYARFFFRASADRRVKKELKEDSS